MATMLDTHDYKAVTNLRIIPPRNGYSCQSTDSTGSGQVSVVRTPSYRFRAGHVLTGATEFLLEKHDEVVPGVVASIPQSCIVEGLVYGERLRTIVDRARLWIDGTRELLECKPDWAAFYRPRAMKQRLLGEAAARELGWTWTPIVPSSLGTRTQQANVDRIYPNRGVHVPDHVKVLASQLLANGPMRLGDFTARIGNHEGNAFSMACAMMVRRILEIDLGEPIAHNSLVRRSAPIPAGLPSIRFGRAGR